jgi:plasmid maintenance system antidote protein VapI
LTCNAFFITGIALPPGEYLAEEIYATKKTITVETALLLEEVIPEIPARFWLNLETDYQITKALTKNA